MHGFETVRATVSCDFCGTANELTLQNVNELLEILCSCCGAPLGRVRDLQRVAHYNPKPPVLRLVS